MHDLRADPLTGRPDVSDTYDVRRHAGASLWSEDEFDHAFHLAARHYLLTENDDRDTWLGARLTNRKAEAGYAALLFLRNTGRLDDLDVPWSAWVGAVIDKAHRLGVAKEGTACRKLLSQMAVRAPTQLGDALQQLVRRACNDGQQPWALSHLASALPPAAHHLLVTLAEELHTALSRQAIDTTPQSSDASPSPSSAMDQADRITLPPTQQARDAALRTWQDLLRHPLIAGDARAVQLVTQALDTVQDSETSHPVGVAAGGVLLSSDAATAWPIIRPKLTESPQFAQDLAQACANRITSDSIIETLSDTELAQVYLWLADTCPPDTEADLTADFYVTGDQAVHEWRKRTLTLLSRRGTTESVRSVRKIVDRFPEDRTLRAALINARRQAQAAAAMLLTHDQVTTLLADPHRRVVRTAVELAEVLIDTIADIQRDLHTHSNLLWDCERVSELDETTGKSKQHRLWRPKREGALSAYIAHELLLRLQLRGIIVNREVMIRPTDEGDSGERPDILVEATATSSWLESIETISVPIEIKGNWHEAVPTAQQDQLMRYLAAKNTDVGIYLVGWYDLEHWTSDDPNPKRAATRLNSPEQLTEILEEQAKQIREGTGKRTFPAILTIPRATPSGRSELSG
ncbi:hypothetical protein ACQPZF_27095 [Actinosynnema sp. CS-041913]|uniref:hypothetical protein n=1 Tax=Actinosynnema sp. CS-041913 TaxID=3239917 RepID=UPI003D94C1B9